MKKINILAAAHHFGSANAISPVVRALNEGENNYDVFPLAFGHAETAFMREGFVNIGVWGDFGRMDLEDITVDAAMDVINARRPDMVLVGSSTETEYNGPEKALTIAAKELGVPTVGVLDFRGTHALRFRDMETGEEGRAMPDVLCLPDEDAVGEILTLVEGSRGDQLRVTGNPFYDSVLARAEGMTAPERAAIRRGISEQKDILFYIANAYEIHRDDERFQRGFWDLDNLKILELALKEFPEVGIGINLHYRYPDADPRGCAKLLRYVESQKRMRIIDPEKVSSLEGALVSDIVATPFSMDAISAATAGRFVISMQPGYERDNLATNKMGVTFRADDARKVSAAVGEVLCNPERVSTYCPNLGSFRSDGKATERIVDEVNASLFL